MPDTELAHIHKAAQGDHEAFRYLVLLYETPILTYLHSLLGDWESARDLAQESFIAAFYALPRWQSPESFKQSLSIEATADTGIDHPLAPWLYRIATNHALTFLKQQSKRNQSALAIQEGRSIDNKQVHLEASQLPGPIDSWENRYVVRELLHQALQQLSDDDACCIILRVIAGERYTEIATRLGLSKEAVRKRVARGLLVLRAVYTNLDGEK